jgi:hypothetical protein
MLDGPMSVTNEHISAVGNEGSLKSTGRAIGSGPWVTGGMAIIYAPKVNDVVLMKGQDDVRCVVIKVDDEAKRAGVQMVSSVMTVHRNIPWPELYEVDESHESGN